MFVAGFMSRSAWLQVLVFSRTREMVSLPFLSLTNLDSRSYDQFAINLASVMLGYVYGETTGTTPSLESWMYSSD